MASVKGEVLSSAEASAVIESVRETESHGRVIDVGSWRTHVLRVDDAPANNANEREAFEAMGLQFTQVTHTAEAMEQVRGGRFAAIISDLGRPEGPRAGFDLLKQIRSEGNKTPFLLYTSSVSPARSAQVSELGGQGVADRPQALFRMVMRAIIDR